MAAAVLVLVAAVPAVADDVTVDVDDTGELDLEVRREGTPGRPGGGTVPAGTPGRDAPPAPARVDPLDPDDTLCPGTATALRGQDCLGRLPAPEPPPGDPAAPPTPDDLGARAASRIPLDAPTLHLTPGPGRTGLVGLPTWLWVDPTPAAWGPATATAAVPGLSVTATAAVDRITWTMGDGTTVTCTTPGTPYAPSRGARPSPDCGHTYTRPGIHTVTATTHWAITWTGGGQTGTLTATRTTTVGDIRVGEMQALS